MIYRIKNKDGQYFVGGRVARFTPNGYYFFSKEEVISQLTNLYNLQYDTCEVIAYTPTPVSTVSASEFYKTNHIDK